MADVLEFQNHIPARGRKLYSAAHCPYHISEEISKPHPRKGTETPRNWGHYINGVIHISKPHPRKGTETALLIMIKLPFCEISKPHPRKGTETVPSADDAQSSKVQFQNHIPARGRKPIDSRSCLTIPDISKPHPRKGTETFSHLDETRSERGIISKPHPRKGTET